MIRITFKDGNIQKFDYAIKDDSESAYHCYYKDDYGISEPISKIQKIEKQVKDLTIEEALKIENLTLVRNMQNSFLGITTDTNEYPEIKSLDDYIDITDLVVGK